MKSVHAWATRGIVVCVGVGATLGIGLSVPSIFIDSSLAFNIVSAVVHRQMERVGAGATDGICIRVDISAALGIGLVVPGIGVAGGLVIHIVRAEVNNDVFAIGDAGGIDGESTDVINVVDEVQSRDVFLEIVVGSGNRNHGVGGVGIHVGSIAETS